MTPSNKTPEMELTIKDLLGHNRRSSITQNRCVPSPIGCGLPVTGFRDELSQKEFSISGLCQTCQDSIFDVPSGTPWTLEEAINLCKKIEVVAPAHGCHVALTGGLLYKEGPRKDLDIILYRIRQTDINVEGLFEALEDLDIEILSLHGFVVKAFLKGRNIDFMFPDEPTGTGKGTY